MPTENENKLIISGRKPHTAVSKSNTTVRPSAGSGLKFAGIDWRVLTVENNRALIISKKVLENRPYHVKSEDITWEGCTLREYLNGAFFNILAEKAKAAIAETSIASSNNPWYYTLSNMTTDRIFLLSLEEVARYFGDSGALKQKKGHKISYFCVKNNKYIQIDKPDVSEWCSFGDQYNSARIAYNKAGRAQRWWLRTPGDRSFHATYVFNNGYVDVGGVDVSAEHVGAQCYGVRPALWLEL